MPTGRGRSCARTGTLWRTTPTAPSLGRRPRPTRELMARPSEILSVAGREVTISNPHKVYFPERGYTKLQLVEYYLAVADGALRGAGGRPMALKRFVDGAAGQPFFQKRAPESRPDWIETVELSFPSGRTADEIVIRDAAQLAWIVNLGCIDLNPHPVRAEDLDHPDELRVDLDPIPGVPWDHVRRVALVVRESLDGPGPDGLAQDVRVAGHPHQRAHRAALDVPAGPPRGAGPGPRRRAAGARPGHQPLVEGGAPRRVHRLQPERQGPDGRLGVLGAPDPRRAGVHAAPLGGRRRPARWRTSRWSRCPRPVRERGRRGRRASMRRSGSLEALLELSARHEAEGQGDAPWPPHYAKPEGEPPRVAPSRQRRPSSEYGPSDASPAVAGPRGARRGLAADANGSAPDDQHPGRRDRRAPSTRSRRSRGWNAGRRAIPRSCRTWSPRTSWSTPCAAGRPRGTGSASTSSMCRPTDRPAQEPLETDYDPWAGFEWPDVGAGQAERAPRRRKRAGLGLTAGLRCRAHDARRGSPARRLRGPSLDLPSPELATAEQQPQEDDGVEHQERRSREPGSRAGRWSGRRR